MEPKKIFEFAERAAEQLTGNENLYIPIPGTNYRCKLSTLLAWLQEQGVDGLWKVTGAGENAVIEAIPEAPLQITATEATNKQLPLLAIDQDGKVRKISSLEFITLTDGAEIGWDMNNSPFAQVTLGGNRELVITNPKPGAVVLVVNQDITGGRQLTFPAGSKYIIGFSINPQAESQTIITGLYNGTIWSWSTGDYSSTPQPSGVVDLASEQTISGLKTFSTIPALPASNPTTDNQAVRKKYTDDTFVDKASAQTVNGIKTFGSIPVLPASNPTTDNQAVRKKYVDDTFITTAVADAKYLPMFANVLLISANTEINSGNQEIYRGAVLLVNSTCTITFGTGLSAGFQCVIIRWGTGEVTIAQNGTTVYSEDSKKRINIRYGAVSVVRVAPNELVLMGNLKT